MPHPYRFSGITDFVSAEGLPPSAAGKIPGLFFIRCLSDALGQIPEARPEHRAGMYAVADDAIAGLKAAVATAESAYAHVLNACPTSEEIAAAEAEAAKLKPAAPIKEKPLAGA